MCESRSWKANFDGLAAKDMARVPQTKEATLRTPLNPAGGESVLIRGRKAILDFFDRMLRAIRSAKLLRYYTGGLPPKPRSASRTTRHFMPSTHFVLKATRSSTSRTITPRDRLGPLVT